MGNLDVGRETVPRRQKQRRNWQNRERGTACTAGKLPAQTLLFNVTVLGLRA